MFFTWLAAAASSVKLLREKRLTCQLGQLRSDNECFHVSLMAISPPKKISRNDLSSSRLKRLVETLASFFFRFQKLYLFLQTRYFSSQLKFQSLIIWFFRYKGSKGSVFKRWCTWAPCTWMGWSVCWVGQSKVLSRLNGPQLPSSFGPCTLYSISPPPPEAFHSPIKPKGVSRVDYYQSSSSTTLTLAYQKGDYSTT